MKHRLMFMTTIVLIIGIILFNNASFARTNKNVTVYLNANGGEISTNRTVLKYNEVYGELPAPTKQGYEFKGWYTLQTGGSQITDTTIVKRLFSHTIYAHWEKVIEEYTATELKETIKEELIENSCAAEDIKEADNILELIEDSDEKELTVNSEKVEEVIKNAGVAELETVVLATCEKNNLQINSETGLSNSAEVNKLISIIKILKLFEIKDGFMKDSIKIDKEAIRKAININYYNIIKDSTEFSKNLKKILKYKENILELITTEEGKKLLDDMSKFVELDKEKLLNAIEIDVGKLLKSLNIKELDFDKLFQNEKISVIFGKSQDVIKEMLKNEELIDAYLKNLDEQRQGIIKLADIDEFIKANQNTYCNATYFYKGDTLKTVSDLIQLSLYTSTAATEEEKLAKAINITKSILYESNDDKKGTEIYLLGLSSTTGPGIDRKQSCGVEEDILVAMGTYNEYLYNIDKAIKEYSIPEGSKILVTGTSLGGMISQQVAAEFKDKYDFIYVIGIECGYIMQNKISQSTQVKLTSLKSDLVTVVPPYAIFEDSVATSKYTILEPEVVNNIQKYKTVLGAHVLGCEDVSFWNNYDVIGNAIESGAHIKLLEDPSYYAAPKYQEEYLKLIENKEKEISFSNVAEAWDEYTGNRTELTIEEFISKVKLLGIDLDDKTPYTYINVKPNGEKSELLILNTNTGYRYVFTEKNLADINLNYIESYMYSVFDLDFNGRVTFDDYSIINKYILFRRKLTKEQAMYYFDFNKNKVITTLDRSILTINIKY